MIKRIFLTDDQAQYLNQLSRVANDYRGSWESLIERGEKEIAGLEANQWVSGPNHQTMAEVQQEYGALKALLNVIWSVFSLEQFDDVAKTEARSEVSQLVAVAQSKSTKSKSISGHTWFSSGKNISDYL